MNILDTLSAEKKTEMADKMKEALLQELEILDAAGQSDAWAALCNYLYSADEDSLARFDLLVKAA